MTFSVGFLQVFSHTSARLSKWSPDIQKQNTQRHPQTKSAACCSPEVSHIPPSFSNKAINAVPSPVWPRSQQYHSRCSVPIGHGLSYAIPAVSSPLATILATPYPLFRPHWPQSQLRHTRCFAPIGHDLSYAIPAVSSPLATISALPYPLYRSPLATVIYQLYHTCCFGPLRPPYQFYHPLTQMSPHWADT